MSWECFDERRRIVDPDERINVGRYLITDAVSGGIVGLKWIGLYGSFWNSRVSSPGDIDLAVDITEAGLVVFNTRVLPPLSSNFGLGVDLFPIDMVRQRYGESKVRELIRSSKTLYGNPPNVGWSLW